MNYKIIFSLFLLIVVSNSNCQVIQLVNNESLHTYDAISAVEFYAGNFYYTFPKLRRLYVHKEKDINVFYNKKKHKHTTASTVALLPGNFNAGNRILFFESSKNKANRHLVVVKPNDLPNSIEYISTNTFFKKVLRVAKGQFKKINIEGAASCNNSLILANTSGMGNHLIVTNIDFFRNQSSFAPNLSNNTSDVAIREIRLDNGSSLTGLAYVPDKKTLFFTAINKTSKKNTKSYIGWISNFEDAIKNNLVLKYDKLIELATVNEYAFENKEITSITFEAYYNNVLKMKLLSVSKDENTIVLNINITY